VNPEDPEDTHDDSSEGSGEGAAEEESQPHVVDESAFEGDDDDDDDDDDMPAHFNVVAHAEESAPAEGDRPEPVPDGPPEIPLHLVDADALWVVKRLHAKGFEAYLTGGCVRDLLLGRTPKDFDVATAAHPNQVKSVFRNCRLVGRRFRLAHVFFPSGKVIETATFRANPIDTLEDLPDDLLVERDNVFGNVEEDARRRDLTVNGLFYDPLHGKVLDFVDGRKDLEARLIRTIGDPEVRFREDPVRILRAIKFATRLGFSIEEKTFAAMKAHVGELVRCAPARLQEEILRLLTSGHAHEAMRLCEDVGVTRAILPELEAAFDMPLEPKPITSLPAPVEAAAEPTPENIEAIAPVVGEGVFQRAEAPPTPQAPLPPAPSERRARLSALLTSLDEAKKRDLDMSSSVAFAVLLAPLWEAMSISSTPWDPWFEETSQKWADRIRLTRHDKERIPQILGGQDDLLPHRRRGHQARQIVHRPSFKEALLVFTLRLHAQSASLEEVGLWKVVAQNANAPYRQPRLSERGPRMRAAAGGERGGGRGGRGRGRDRGRRRRR
jgi:poly(A) polymerase